MSMNKCVICSKTYDDKHPDAPVYDMCGPCLRETVANVSASAGQPLFGGAKVRAPARAIFGVSAVSPLGVALEALDGIACWGEGDKVTAGFDEPGAAKAAREAIAKICELLPPNPDVLRREGVCIYPGCGRPVGSKGQPHLPNSCGKSTCETWIAGFEASEVRIGVAGQKEDSRVLAMAAILETFDVSEEKPLAQLLTAAVDAVLRERERAARIVENYAEGVRLNAWADLGDSSARGELRERGLICDEIVPRLLEVAKRIRIVP